MEDEPPDLAPHIYRKILRRIKQNENIVESTLTTTIKSSYDDYEDFKQKDYKKFYSNIARSVGMNSLYSAANYLPYVSVGLSAVDFYNKMKDCHEDRICQIREGEKALIDLSFNKAIKTSGIGMVSRIATKVAKHVANDKYDSLVNLEKV